MKISFENFHLYKSEKRIEDEELLNIPSLQFDSGKINVIKSVSGLGKTQLLNTICGQNQSFTGTILFDGQEPKYDSCFFKTKCSYMTSDDCCLADMTIKDQLSIVSKEQNKIDEVARRFRLTPIFNQKIAFCSSGEKKRVEIATVLLKNLPILLLDEPTANLDENNSILILDALKEFAKTHLVIVASHENDILLDDCNIYEIQSHRIIPIKKTSKTENDATDDCTENIEIFKISPKVSLKFGFSKSFKNKLSFIFGFVFCFLFFCSTFFCCSVSTINQSDTLSMAMDSLPFDYTRILYDDGYISKDDDVFSCTQASLATTYGSLINATCVEDLTGDLKSKCQDIFDDYVIDHPLEAHTFYHPAILTRQQQAFFKNKGLVLNVGDILPVTFSNCAYALGHSYESDRFVIAGILDTNEESNGEFSLSGSFPFIVKREDYLACLRHTGIRCDTFNDSIKSVLKEYRNYCQANGIEYGFDEGEFTMDNLIPYSMFEGLYKKYSSGDVIYENDGYVYYIGNLPDVENWIMVPEDESSIDDFYDFLEESDFFSKYKANDIIELPLTDDFKGIGYDSLKSFSVQGLYLVNDTSLVMKDCVIVSDSLFYHLLASICASKNHKDFVSIHISYADKSWLKEKQQLILSDRSIVFHSDSLMSLFKAFDNMVRFQTFTIVFCIIICALSLLFALIYFIGIRNRFTKDFAALTLLGISKFEKWRLLLISVLPMVFGSYLLSLSVSKVFSDLLINLIATNSGFHGNIITSNLFFCYLIQLISCLVFLSLTFALSELRKKKNDISAIKENKE